MRFVLPLLPAAYLVGCAEPAPEEALPAVEPGDSAALFITSGQVVLTGIERCYNGKDDDGDGLVDKQDPECKNAGGPGGLGFQGDVQEGTGIMPNPEESWVRFGEGEIAVVYTQRGTEGLKDEYSLLSIRMPGEREDVYSYMSITRGEIVAIYGATLEGDREPSMILDVDLGKEDIASYLAQGPIGNNVYTDQITEQKR